MIQRYVHPHAAKNMSKIGHVSRSFLYKVIFQSNPLCSGGGYTLRIHWHTYSPRTTRIWPLDSDITFVIMRIYIFPLPRPPTTDHPMYGVYCGRCTCSVGSCMCGVRDSRDPSSNDVPPKHQSRHAISRFLSIEIANFCPKCVQSCLSLNSNSHGILHPMVVHLSFTFAVNPTEYFKVIGLRLQSTVIGVDIFWRRSSERTPFVNKYSFKYFSPLERKEIYLGKLSKMNLPIVLMNFLPLNFL